MGGFRMSKIPTEKRLLVHTRPIADGLTLLRSLLGVALAGLSTAGKNTLSMAVLLVLSAWISDFLDGPLARHDTDHSVTWIGRHDLEADMTAAGGTWIYLWGSGLIGFPLLLGVSLVSMALLVWTRSIHVTSAFMAISYGTFLGISLRDVPSSGALLIGWLIFLVIVTWPRFLHKADEFLKGMRDLFQMK